jgi:hypothetical protein
MSEPVNQTQIMKLKAAVYLISLALVEHSYGTVTPISSSITLHAESNAGEGLVQDDQFAGQTTTLNGLSASVLALAVNGTLDATSESTASATWTSASEGQFAVDTRFTTDDLSPFYDSRVAAGGDPLIYSFSSDVPATLTLDYGIASTSGWGIWGMAPFISLSGGPDVEQTELSVPSSGSLSFDISPGRNYTLELYDGSNLNDDLPAFTSEMAGTFSFQITPAPEPDSLTLLGIAVAASFSIHTRKTGATPVLRS